MTTLTSDEQSSLDSPLTHGSSNLNRGCLTLRIVQSDGAEQTVTLPFGKCTVGSSPRCHVSLADKQVRPLHCLIVSDGVDVSVTRWAPDVLLNDQEFTTAPFRPGDCLQIGTSRLLLLAEDCDAFPPEAKKTAGLAMTESVAVGPVDQPTAATPVNSAFAARQPCVNDGVLTALNVETEVPASEEEEQEPENTPIETSAVVTTSLSASNQIESDRLVSKLWTANYGARKRCRQLLDSLRTVRGEVDGFDQRINDLQQQLNSTLTEREQIFTELAELQAEASQRETQSTEEIDRLISELTLAYEKTSKVESVVTGQALQTEQLQTELALLESQRDQWEQMRSAGELQRTKLVQALADSEQCIETLQAEIERVRELAEQADVGWANQKAELADLQQAFERVQAERDQLIIKLGESQQSQQEFEQTLASHEQSWLAVQAELENFQQASCQAEQELGAANEQFEVLKVEFAQLSKERDQLVAKRTEHQLREQGWEHELSSRDEKISALTSEIESLRKTINYNEQETTSQETQIESYEQQLSTLTTERDQLLVAQAEQVRNLQQWEEKVTDRDRRIAELDKEHASICNVLQSVEEGAFERVDFCNKLEQQLATLRTERDQLSELLPEQQEYINQLENTLSERDRQVTLLSEELTQTAERQSQLETEFASGTAAYQALEAELATLNARCEQLADAQSVSEQSQLDTEQMLAESRKQAESLQTQLSTAEQALQERTPEQDLPTAAISEATPSDNPTEVSAELVTDLPSEVADLASQPPVNRDVWATDENSAADFPAENISGDTWEQDDTSTSELSREDSSHRDWTDPNEPALEASSWGQSDEVTKAEDESFKHASASGSGDVAATEEDTNEVLCEPAQERLSEEETFAGEETYQSTSTAFQAPTTAPEEPTQEFQPPSFIDQYQHLLEEDGNESCQPLPAPTAPVASNKLGAELDAMASSQEEDEEEALEAYMSNMLKRMRGEDCDQETQLPPASSDTKLDQDPNPVVAVDDVLDQVAPARDAVDSEPFDLEKLKQSSHKPALPTDLAAMRELANSSARRAIAKHHQRRHLEKALGFFFVCLIFICVGSYLMLNAVASQQLVSLTSLSGVAAILVGTIGGFKLLGLLLLAIREGSPAKKSQAKQTEVALPIQGTETGASSNGQGS